MAFKYPNMIKAMEMIERDQWSIGDALLKDIPIGPDGVNTGASYKIAEAQQEAAANGFEYETETLRKYREISAAFPAGIRIPAVSHRIHVACRTPERLKAVLAGWKRDLELKGEPERKLPLHDCTRILSTMHQDKLARMEEVIAADDAEYAAKQQAAQADLDAANAELEAAKDRVATAPTLAARRTAVSARDAAETRQRAARSARNNLPGRPKPDPNYVPEPELMPTMVFMGRMRHKAEDASRLAEQALADTATLAEYELTDANVGALMEAVQSAANNWRRVVEAVSKQTGRRRAHLMAVQ